MDTELKMRVIAHMHSDFPEKFGIPRQSGIVDEFQATVVFEPKYRDPDAFRGLEGFSHLWLLWQFSACADKDWSPTVRPPRLGGNTRMGVFATRSPFRPNHIGLSCVRLLKIDFESENAPILLVAGADLMDGTPIFDIKPYSPYADCIPDAVSAFAPTPEETLPVVFTEGTMEKVPENKLAALRGVLANDPRPRYQNSSERIYAMEFAGLEVKFRVENKTVFVTEINK